MHERPVGLSDADEQRIVSKGLDAFELFAHRRPNGYRSPS
jgi:hypothetical protein